MEITAWGIGAGATMHSSSFWQQYSRTLGTALLTPTLNRLIVAMAQKPWNKPRRQIRDLPTRKTKPKKNNRR